MRLQFLSLELFSLVTYTLPLYNVWAQHIADIFQSLPCIFLSYPLLYIHNVLLVLSHKFSVFHYKADFLMQVKF